LIEITIGFWPILSLNLQILMMLPRPADRYPLTPNQQRGAFPSSEEFSLVAECLLAGSVRVVLESSLQEGQQCTDEYAPPLPSYSNMSQALFVGMIPPTCFLVRNVRKQIKILTRFG
jgi:hypothetical protein